MSAIFSSSTKNGNCEKEYSRALDKANIGQLLVSAPYEFLVRSNYAVNYNIPELETRPLLPLREQG